MEKYYKITAIAVICLGCIHIAFTPVFYKEFNIDAIWFSSCGIAFVFAGFFNYFASILSLKKYLNFALIINIISLIISILITYKLKEPQAFLSIILFIALLSFNFLRIKKKKQSQIR